MNLTKIVAKSAIDFGIGAALGIAFDGFFASKQLDYNLMDAALGGLSYACILKYSHKILGGEPHPNSTVARRSLALTSGLFVGQSLVTAVDYLSKL